MERSFEAWEEVQRHGQDLMDRVAQGVTGFIQSQIVAAPPVVPPFHWPPAPAKAPFVLDEIGGRLGQAGTEIGNYFNGVVQQFFRQLPPPFRLEDDRPFIDPRQTFMGFGISILSGCRLLLCDAIHWIKI